MKKITFCFTPPKKFAIVTCAAIIGISMIGTSTAYASKSKPSEKSMIDGFRGYAWGTSLEDIENQEITPGMKDILDYQWDELPEQKFKSLTITNSSIDHRDASVGYVFYDNKLTSAGYDLDIDENIFSDMSDGISEKYDDAVLEKGDTGWGKCSVWIDEDTNCIILSEMLGLLYIEADSPFIEFYGENLEKFHEIDLQNELSKAGDGYVGY